MKTAEAKTQGLYQGKIKNDKYRGHFLPDSAADQMDELDNATYQYICQLAQTAGQELPWNMEHIGPVRDAAVRYLKEQGIPIWFPYMEED